MITAARWTVPADHPAYAGHFPGNPVLPGAVLLDVALHFIADASGLVLDRCEVGAVKFLNPVLPGDELEIRHELSAAGLVRFDIVSGLRQIASGSVRPGMPE